ncbi:MAG: hypothetical protein KGL35_22880, partial [Bradyrhizobium sp.]|nr:hypothetical protein [Bradyrhizobium sp.]
MCGGSCGSTSNTVTQQNAPPAWVQNAYQGLVGAGQRLASQPLQQYSGPMVAGFAPQQQQAFSQIQNAQGVSLPYINAAAQYMSSAAAPITVPGG